jgi:hypothetical protein
MNELFAKMNEPFCQMAHSVRAEIPELDATA